MEFNVFRHINSVALRELVPKHWHSQFRWSELADVQAAVVIFSSKRKEVVTSKSVRQALDSIQNLTETFKVAIGVRRDFTKEASELLEGRGFYMPVTKKPTLPVQASATIPFPEPVRYSRSDCPSGWSISNWQTANKLLSYLDPDRRHFATFDLQDGSYVQCLGCKKALTVEARIYRPDGTFTHWVFGKGSLDGQMTRVGSRLGMVTVDRSQVLQMRDARLIVRQFLETRTFPERFSQLDITNRFANLDFCD